MRRMTQIVTNRKDKLWTVETSMDTHSSLIKLWILIEIKYSTQENCRSPFSLNKHNPSLPSICQRCIHFKLLSVRQENAWSQRTFVVRHRVLQFQRKSFTCSKVIVPTTWKWLFLTPHSLSVPVTIPGGSQPSSGSKAPYGTISEIHSLDRKSVV